MKLNGNKSASRILYIDILRIVSVFAVVVLHTSAPLVENLYTNGTKIWWIGNIIDSATRWCVPVLIMVSGKLMLSSKKEIEISSFLKKRFSKVLIPLLVWSLIYMVWYGELSLQLNLSMVILFIRNFYEGKVYVHLWYLYMLVGFYLITPIIKIYVNNTDSCNLKYFITIWFIANGIIGFLEKFIEPRTDLNLSFFHWSIGYYVLGFFLGKQNISRKIVNTLYAMGIIGLIVTIYATYVFTKNNIGIFVPHFYSYFAPNVIFMSVSIFLLFKNMNWKRVVNNRLWLDHFIVNLSNKSFGIYLVHLLVLDTISSKIIKIPASTEYLYTGYEIFVVSIITFLISYGIVAVFQKIPLLKNIVPK